MTRLIRVGDGVMPVRNFVVLLTGIICMSFFFVVGIITVIGWVV